MRLLATSDWHLDAMTLGHPRRDELLSYLKRLLRAVVEEEIDVVVFAGDAADPGSMLGCRYEADLIRWFFELAMASRLKMLLAVAGNHDVVEVSSPLTTLTPAREALRPEMTNRVLVVVNEVPGVVRVREHNVAFLALPYVARAWADAEARGEQTVTGPEHCMDVAFASAQKLRDEDCELVVVGHRTVPTARLGSESMEMSRGRDVDLPIDRIAALRPALVINGHYHRPQVVQIGGIEVVIPGSPLSFTTDDPAAGKGYVVAEV
jgi:DNA repair exonuclease SbcCD nuclease subunit